MDQVQLKLLILYVLNHLIQPVTLPQLTEQVLQEDGMDYFSFAESLVDLTESGHILLDDRECYAITSKGRQLIGLCIDSVPYIMRQKCDRSTGILNARLRRNGQIQTNILPRNRKEYTVQMSLSDDAGPVISMELLSYSREQSEQLARNFEDHAEEIFNAILSAVLANYEPGPGQASS